MSDTTTDRHDPREFQQEAAMSDTVADRIAQGETEAQARDEAPIGGEYDKSDRSWTAHYGGLSWCETGYIDGDGYSIKDWNDLCRTLRRAATLEAENEKLSAENSRLRQLVEVGTSVKIDSLEREKKWVETQLAEERKRREGLEKELASANECIKNLEGALKGASQ